jgi:UDPglucose--hexose-1-phosphate uridylyltransferase
VTPRLRRDPLSGRLIAFAPARARRPGASAFLIEPEATDERERCPFCEGHEDRTPPEVFALPSDGREPDSPGWRVRVVPNLYPAFERQEVVIHSPRHVRTFAELSNDEIAYVAEAWTARIATAGTAYVHALINEGRAAGASLPHSHSQLVWLPGPPPEVQAERPEGLVELVENAREQNLVLADADDLVAFCHPVGRLPYETLVAPGPDATLTDALRVLRDLIARLREAEGPVPWNAWLHRAAPWHIELVPRLSVLAGIELGAGIYVNALPPEQAAENLRRATDR